MTGPQLLPPPVRRPPPRSRRRPPPFPDTNEIPWPQYGLSLPPPRSYTYILPCSTHQTAPEARPLERGHKNTHTIIERQAAGEGKDSRRGGSHLVHPQSRGGRGEGHPCLPCDTHYGHRRPTPSFSVCVPGRRSLYRAETDEQQHEEKVEARQTRTAAVTDCELPRYACPQPVPLQAHHSPP